jgi:hypothetical protein
MEITRTDTIEKLDYACLYAMSLKLDVIFEQNYCLIDAMNLRYECQADISNVVFRQRA